MRKVLAALDSSPAARAVLDAAVAFGELTGAEVEAVHVGHDGDVPRWVASQCGVPLRLLAGEEQTSLLAALAEEDAIAAVFGARGTRGGRRPAGHTAMQVLEAATKPVVVVPPDGALSVASHRVLIPLEGDPASSQPVRDRLVPMLASGAELVVVHVFTPDTMPRVLDHPVRDLELWGEEFVARFCPGAASIRLRTGVVGTQIDEVAAEEGAGLVVLSWSRDMSAGHAAVIRHVLAESDVPVLLLPVIDQAPT